MVATHGILSVLSLSSAAHAFIAPGGRLAVRSSPHTALRMAIPDNPKKEFSPFNENLPPTQPVGNRSVGPVPESTNPSGTSSGASSGGAQGEFAPFSGNLPPTKPVGRTDVGPVSESTNPSDSTTQANRSVTTKSTTEVQSSTSGGQASVQSSTSGGQASAQSSTSGGSGKVSGTARDDLQKVVGQELQQIGADVVYDDQSIDLSDAASKEIVREAPLIKERIFEETTVVDKTQIEKDVRKTVVQQVVQPIREKEQRDVDVTIIDKGREVREIGQEGLDVDTRAELERRKQEVAAKLATERDSQTKKLSERPDVVETEQVKVVEQVIPVLEKDIYVPKRVEEEKYIKEIIYEKPVVKETIVEPTITRAEFEEKYGKVENSSSSSVSSSVSSSSTQMSSSSSSSGNLNTAQDAQNKAKELGEKAKSKAADAIPDDVQNKAKELGEKAKSKAADAIPEDTQNKAKELGEKVKSKAEQGVDTLKAKASEASDGSDSGSDHYSMSADGMMRDAENDNEGGGLGIGKVIAAPFKAVANVAKKLVD